MTTLRIALSLLALCGLAAPATAQTAGTGLQTERLLHGGLARTYHYHVPANRPAGKLPVLFALHGGGKGTGEDMAKRNTYNAVADREGFLVVYPEGVDAQWNDGRGVTFRGSGASNVDDVGFFAKLFDRVVRRHNADPQRLYVTGQSNGGMMTMRLGIELGDRIAAIAPVIANLPKNLENLTPLAPMPTLIMNGTDDQWVPWAGGSVMIFGRRPAGEILSTMDTVQFWIQSNGATPRVTSYMLPDIDPNDGARIFVSVVAGLRAPVVLYAVQGGGHAQPGSGPHPTRILGNKCRDIEGVEHIWQFVEQFTR